MIGTALRPGDRLPRLLGYEADRVFGSAPPGTTILAESPYTFEGHPHLAHMTIYTSLTGRRCSQPVSSNGVGARRFQRAESAQVRSQSECSTDRKKRPCTFSTWTIVGFTVIGCRSSNGPVPRDLA